MAIRTVDIFIYLCVALLVGQIDAISRTPNQCPFAQHRRVRRHTSYKTGLQPSLGKSEDGRNELDIVLKNFLSSDESLESAENEKLECSIAPVNCPNATDAYYRTLDGACNNFEYPGFGMARSRQTRLLPPFYGNGISSPTVSITGGALPNARDLSVGIFGEETLSDFDFNMAAMQWGQVVSHDIVQLDLSEAPEDCCESKNDPMCFPIALRPEDPIAQGSGQECLSFSHATSDVNIKCPQSAVKYAEKISLQTPYLDLSMLYGNSEKQNDDLRVHKGGLLKMISNEQNRPFIPFNNNEKNQCVFGNTKCFSIPDQRQQMTATIAVLHTILVREHNRIAIALSNMNPHFTDEHVFQIARKINIAQMQKITFYDWLPLVLGSEYASQANLVHYVKPFEYVPDYDSKTSSGTFAEFSAAAFRYLHTTIPGWFTRISRGAYSNETLRLSDFIQNPKTVDLLLQNNSLDALIRGLVIQPQKQPDINIDPEIKHFFGRTDSEEFGTDLKALDIQRARDVGLPPYNVMRTFCGLPKAYDWSGFADVLSTKTIAKLQSIYKHPDDVDLNVGGALERHLPGTLFGPTFHCIVTKQFYHLRTTDRFFFENGNQGGFTKEQLAEIRKVSLASLLCQNGDNLEYIQPNAFIVPGPGNVPTSCANIPYVDLTKWIDY